MDSRARQSHNGEDDPLAYGDYHGSAPDPAEVHPEGEDFDGGAEGERGIIGDTYRKYRTKYQPTQQQGGSQSKPSGGLGSFIFHKLHDAVNGIGSSIDPGQAAGGGSSAQSHTHGSAQHSNDSHTGGQHRYGSFASQRTGNDAKWYVDGCSYMWAVSRALEQATTSIWILDWWLSPELYLRRPASRNEQYRLDRMLQAAAQRGVKVNIIVYKEVTQALTRKYLSPTLPGYLHSLLPSNTDVFTKSLTGMGVAAAFVSLEHVEKENPLILPPLTVCSSHTKHALEKLHPNIAVFRHPDHLPDAQTLQSSFLSSLQNLSLSAKTATQLPVDALKAIYGMNEDVILYWAHHEKLCLIDGKTAFMGGLDLCYGRWDTNQHPLADCHPSNLDNIVFPGQDYNNARIMDFQDVPHWQNNKLNRKDSSRMGWSDVSICLTGPVVEDLRAHFVERWNFIYNEKYDVRKDVRYSRLTLTQNAAGASPQQTPFLPPPSNQPYQPYGSRPVSSSSQGQQNYGPSQGHGQYPPPQQSYPQQSYDQQPQQQQYGDYPPPPPQRPPQHSHISSAPQSYGEYPPPPRRPYGQGSYQGQAPSQPSYEQPQQAYGGQSQSQPGQQQAQYFPPPPSSARGMRDDYTEESSRGIDDDYPGEGSRGIAGFGGQHHDRQQMAEDARGLGRMVWGRLEEGRQHLQGNEHHGQTHGQAHGQTHGRVQNPGISGQIVRSCSKWSHGVGTTEHSIANAYINVIQNSQHFVYIENQFFITATSDAQKPVKNKIGAAMVERILRAARAGEKYRMIIVIPAIPGFAGDLKDDASLGTRAIMEFQYNSINRGGHSIMETISREGVDPNQYISFYNLRNYDRINVSGSMRDAEQKAGVDYEVARGQYDAAVELPAGDVGGQYVDQGKYQHFQQATTHMNRQQGLYTGEWDSVSECYMLGGRDIRQVPWEAGDYPEIKAFVSEELYVHSKVCIADDRVAIVGSANLNDRSQLGDHDSEIAIIIEDPSSIDSYMNGRPYRAAKFAATLRRQLFRKHLGLLKPQNMEHPDQNSEPIGVPNSYDFGSREDQAVADPLSDNFLQFWNDRARTNSFAFGRVFHPVPHDDVRNWKDYDAFYEKFFKEADAEAEGKGKEAKKKTPAKYMWGHVVEDNFSHGERGVSEVKDLLSTVKGTLVDMPLQFLIEEDIAKEGMGLNAFTEEVYT